MEINNQISIHKEHFNMNKHRKVDPSNSEENLK